MDQGQFCDPDFISATHQGKIFNLLRKEKVNVQLCILIDLKTDRIKDIDNYFL